MSGRLIVLDKQPGVCMVEVGETWQRLFTKFSLWTKGPESTNECQDDQLSAGSKAGIYGDVHGVQDIWDAKYSMEDWGFLLVDAKMCSMKLLEPKCCGRFTIYGHPELVLFLTVIVTGKYLSSGMGM